MASPTPDQFGGQVVVVTGAASGMGAASAREFSSRGATVVLVDLDVAGAAVVADECRDLQPVSATVSVEAGNVAESAFCLQSIERTVADFGRIDVLVNAAGTIHRADSLGTTDDDWRRVMSVNVDGMFFMCRSALKYMVGAGSGAIVNFGSIWGGVGSAGATAYCVSKGAVHQLTRALALDHVEHGIRVNAVAPGEVRTDRKSVV